MVTPDTLTAEQRTVVRHGTGPAVVLAVPGAGKTTALVHRLRHLVRERDVAPARLLACSFNRDTTRDLSAALEAHGLREIDVRTLHSLGYAILRQANSASAASVDRPDATAYDLARQALRDLAVKRNQNRDDLRISAPDLVDQNTAWKQQLAYPDLDAADLTPDGRDCAQQAAHDNEDYLMLYRRFEHHRRAADTLTYPDMIRNGWATVLRENALRADLQQAYDYVLVDEFQDVSRAQFQLLDLLTARHRNLMVIGDDDQCIYGWRGASPSYLRRFADQYNANTYRMQTSFRLPGAPLVLANAVIRHNQDRSSKRIRLVRGFEGDARLIEANSPATEAARIADRIHRLWAEEEVSFDEMAILVRTYGQTPPLEQALLDRELPYTIQGHAPFYRRRPVQTLLRYLYWAVLERRRRTNDGFHSPQQVEQYTDRFRQIVNAPNRYVARGRLDRIVQEVHAQHTSVLDVTARHLPEMHERTAERVDAFLDVAEGLVHRLDAPADATLEWLVEAIGYETALRARSASSERGMARVQTAQSLIRYARAHDTALALLNDVRSLATEQANTTKANAAIDIRSIHRAKGLEWPVVILPGCTEGTFPLKQDGASAPDVAEERRLFYVGVTRTQQQLYLSTPSSRSRFLDEAEVDTRLPLSRAIQTALTTDPSALSDEQLAHLCRGLVDLKLETYIQQEWSPSAPYKDALRTRLRDFSSVLTDAQDRWKAYQQALDEYEQAQDEARTKVQNRVQTLQKTLGDVQFTARHDASEAFYPDDALFRFEWASDETEIEVHWNDTQIGLLDPFRSGALDAQAVMALPWTQLVGRFASMGRGRDRLRFTIDWTETKATWSAAAVHAQPAPTPLDERSSLLARADVSDGCHLLLDRLAPSTDE